MFSKIHHLVLMGLVTILLPLCSIMLYGQTEVPGSIVYSGTLTDKSGTLMEGLRSVRFGIYDSFTGGTQLWSDTQSLELKYGSFNAVLGSQSNPLPVNLGYTTAYLQIEVLNGSSWETFVPRISIAGSVYAIKTPGENSGRCPDDMIWTGSFCIEETKRGYGSWSMAIKACATEERRLCSLNEMTWAYINKSALGLDDFYVSPSQNDYEWAGDKTETRRAVIPNIVYQTSTPFQLLGYTAGGFIIATCASYWVGPTAPHCVPGYFENPDPCLVFAYYRCCTD